MVFICTDGIFQYATGKDFIRHYVIDSGMLQGPFVSKNSFAAWLVIMIPLALAILCSAKEIWNVLSKKYIWIRITKVIAISALVGTLIFCLIFTHSRGGQIGAISAMVFFGIFKSKKVLIATAVIMLCTMLLYPPFINEQLELGSRFLQPGEIRMELWKEAAAIIEDFPLFGCGFNTYALVGPYYRVTGGAGSYPHNCYLQMAAESGLLGLGAFIWIIFMLFRTSLLNLRRIGEGFYNNILVGLLAGLFGFLVHSFIDVNIYSLQLGNLMWFIMGMAMAVQRIALKL